MTALVWLVPAALALGGMALAAFLWSLESGQLEDLDGAAWRALDDEPVKGGPVRSEPGVHTTGGPGSPS